MLATQGELSKTATPCLVTGNRRLTFLVEVFTVIDFEDLDHHF